MATEPPSKETLFEPGQRLAQYEVLRRIGAGGMGIVYLARDLDLDRQVAIKLLRLSAQSASPSATDDRAADRFLREARLAAKLNHPNVAAIYQIGRHDALTFIAMEWIDGGNLADHLQKSIFLEWQEATRAIRDAAAGLHAAHTAGLIHRDLKPTNLMRTAGGDVKLVDFGLARAYDAPSDLTHSGSILGTPAYLSPEQCRGLPATPLSDIYALACTFFHLLTSRPPFTSPDIPGLLYQHVNEPLPDPRRFADEIPESLCRILERGGAKNPADRYPSAAAMRDDLEAALAGREITISLPISTIAVVPPTKPPPGNLPQEVSSFIAREGELAHAKHLLRQGRLVTLIGSGGTGKTRLSIQTARQMQAEFPDGTWLVELAALAPTDDVARAVAAVLGVRESANHLLVTQISDHLRGKRVLLLLDNCEHVIDTAAALAAKLTTTRENLHILATSRQSLGCPGEATLRVPSLELPDADAQVAPQDLERIASVKLFCDRASAARSAFALTPDNAAAIVQICRRLDGIPLAIELAAARIKVLTAQQIAERLDDAFKLLTTGARTLLPRQQTLRALIDWSYDLLARAERIALARLSVFAGGCTFEAAEAVLADGSSSPGAQINTGDALDLLSELVDKSLILADERDGAVRYRMLETIRQYSAEKLSQSTDRAAVRRRHAAYFTRFAYDAIPRTEGVDQTRVMVGLDAEHDNLRTALDRCIEERDIDLGLTLGAALARYWYIRGTLAEGLHRLQRLLALDPPASAGLATVLDRTAILATYFGQHDKALAWFNRALDLARAHAARETEGSVLNNLGTLAKERGELPRALEYFQQALNVRRQVGDRIGEAGAINNLAITARIMGQIDLARKRLHEALAIHKEMHNARWVGYINLNLGELEHEEGNVQEAKSLYESSLKILSELDEDWGQAYALEGLGKCALSQGDYASARRRFEQTLAIVRKFGDQSTVADQLDHLARLALQAGEGDSAIRLARESIEVRFNINDQVGIAASLETQAVFDAPSNPTRAATLLGCADALRQSLGAPLPPSRRAEHEKLLVQLQSTLGKIHFEEAFQSGRSQESSRLLRA